MLNFVKNIFGFHKNRAAGPQELPVPRLHEDAGPRDRPVPGLNEVPGPRDRPVPGLNEVPGPRDRPVPGLNEVPGPRERPVPGLNKVPGPRDRPVPGLNEVPGPRDHPKPKPGVRRKRQSGEEEEEEETRPFKRQQTLRLLPWPRPHSGDEPATATDQISDLRKQNTALLARLLQAEKQLLSQRARHDRRVEALETTCKSLEAQSTQDVDRRLLAENLLLKQQVLKLSQSKETLVGTNEAMARRIKDMEDNATEFFEVIEAGFKSRTMELRQDNLRLVNTQKTMVDKIQAMEDEYFKGLQPEFSRTDAATPTATSWAPYYMQLPPSPSPSCTPLPFDSDSDFDDDLYVDRDDSYGAQGKKRKREESAHSRAENPPFLSELNDFFHRNKPKTQAASAPSPLDETVVVTPASLMQALCVSTPALQPGEVVYDFRDRARKRLKLYGSNEYKDPPWRPEEEAPGGTLFLIPPPDPQP